MNLPKTLEHRLIKANNIEGEIHSKRQFLQQYIFQILPRVKKLLQKWEQKASKCKDEEIRKQALASLKLKDFHCQGGAVFAVFAESGQTELLRLIVAYQTICDYLDNLCDRVGETSGPAFLQLHQSLLAALDIDQEHVDYYQYYSLKNDGGYLIDLVEECRGCLKALPSYPLVKDEILLLAKWYIELQVYKHIDWEIRENRLQSWAYSHLPGCPGLLWNEWAAACGSTLALFALLRLACRQDIDTNMVKNTRDVYFPQICALHILLDYFIDQEEDRQGKDLNFISYYHNLEQAAKRIKLIIRESRKQVLNLQASNLDDLVIEGLLAMYLSDAKVSRQGFQRLAREFMEESGGSTRQVYTVCSIVRKII